MSDNILQVMNSDQKALTMGAIRTLHTMFGTGMGAFEKCGEAEHKELLSRAHTAIGATGKAERREAMKAAKEGVDNVVLEAFKAYKVAEGEFAKLSPAVLALTGAKLPDSVRVPIADVVECFPAGTPVSDIRKLLLDMSYRLSGGKGKDDISIVVQVKSSK